MDEVFMSRRESLVIFRDGGEIVIRFKKRELFRMGMDVSEPETQRDLVSLLREILIHAAPADSSKIIENGIVIAFSAPELAELIRSELAISVLEGIKHDVFKMLYDQNPDGSVTYTKNDMKIITEEFEAQQKQRAALLGDDYNSLIAEIESRIKGIATYADEDKASAVQVNFEYPDMQSSDCIAKVSIWLWGEKLNQVRICHEGEMIGPWELSKESTSHDLIFTKKIPKEIIRQTITEKGDF